MNDLCTALADALRKAAVKWPEKFEVFGSKGLIFLVKPDGTDYDLSRLDVPHLFPCDAMDAVAAALGYWLDMDHSLTMDGHDLYCSHWGKLGHGAKGAVDFKPDKRTASLAALLAIITHALEDGK